MENTKKKSNKKLIIILAVVAVFAVALVLTSLLKPKDNGLVVDLADTTVLKYRNLEKTISGNGIVESANITLVYSTLGYLVESVEVELGDYVEEGQLLATLDGEAIQNQITSAQINMNTAQTAQQQQIQMAQTNYDNFVYALEHGLNTNLNTAKLQADNAKKAYETATDAYMTYLDNYKTSIEGSDNQDELYEDFLKNDETLKNLSEAMQAAGENYDNAKTALNSVRNALDDQLEGYRTALKNAKENANIDAAEESIRQLKVSLSDTKIKAPVSGTVTAVYAKKGASGSGLLFVIEDVDDLIVTTNIKGYDIDTVKEGCEVRLTSEAIDDAEISGVLTKVAPTANKNAYGMTDKTSEVLFAAEVEVTTQNSGLKIGMEADLDYIIEASENVLTVPYDAVYQKDGRYFLIAIEEQKDGRYLLSEIEVSTGMDDDLDITVSGVDLKEGIRILNVPDNYRDYIGQSLKSGTIDSSPFPFPMG